MKGSWGIQQKLILGFMAIIFLFSAASFYSSYQSGKISNASAKLSENTYPVLEGTNKLLDLMRQITNNLLASVDENDRSLLNKGEGISEEFIYKINELYRQTSDEDLAAIKKSFEEYFEKSKRAVDVVLSGGDISLISQDIAKISEKAKVLSATK